MAARATGTCVSEKGPVAPAWHTAIVILLVLAPAAQAALAGRGGVSRPPAPLPFYLTGIVVLWMWLLVVWLGVRRRTSLALLIGGAWTGVRQAGRDAGLAALFWVLWYGVLTAVKGALTAGGMTNGAAPGMVFPQGTLQVGVWIISALSAGIVEEVIFRGYLMRQFTAWCDSALVAVLLQAALFGIAHGYALGLRQVIVIGVSGVMIGLFVLWQRHLRSAIVFHTWADIFGAAIVRGLPF